MDVGKRIKNRRKKLNLSVGYIAKELGVDRSTVYRYESSDIEKFPVQIVEPVAKLLKTTPAYLMGWTNVENDYDRYTSYAYIPTSISTGIPIDIESISKDNLEKIKIPDVLMGDYAEREDIFITKISGDSMDKVIPDGSFIAVKKVKDVKELQDNDIVLFSNQHEYSVKRYFKINNKVVFKPDSTNPDHFDQVMTTDDDFASLIIYGKVVWYVINI